jgi:hypothetical protein
MRDPGAGVLIPRILFGPFEWGGSAWDGGTNVAALRKADAKCWVVFEFMD